VSLLDRNAALLAELATEHHLEVRALRALLEVEAGGEGLTEHGPVIRLEVHKLWMAVRPSQRMAVNARFVVRGPRPWEGHEWLDGGHWVPLHQPIREGGQEREHRALLCARAIDEAAAIGATSWGCGQVLGQYWRELGYPSPGAFAIGMQSEACQILAVMKHLEVISAAIPDLRERRWADVARKYNGNGAAAWYSGRLAEAYERLG
jgi:hypothetical protein